MRTNTELYKYMQYTRVQYTSTELYKYSVHCSVLYEYSTIQGQYYTSICIIQGQYYTSICIIQGQYYTLHSVYYTLYSVLLMRTFDRSLITNDLCGNFY